MNESIVTGKKYRVLADESTGKWDRISFWTSASDTEMEDGSTVEDAITELRESGGGGGTGNGIINITQAAYDALSEEEKKAKCYYIKDATSGTSIAAVQEELDELSDSIGTIPQGKTVEGQITEINSNLTNLCGYLDMDNVTNIFNQTTLVNSSLTYTATEDGFICGTNKIIQSPISTCSININNIEVALYADYTGWISYSYPIKKGQTFKIINSNSGTLYGINLIKFIKKM